MRYRITAPKTINTTVDLPASKSISNRVLAIQALAGGGRVENISVCDDTDVMVRALGEMPHTIDIGAAGTAMRFMTAYLSQCDGEHVITGTERMRHRPIGVLVDALRNLGADIEYVGEQGFPPLRIRGRRLEGGSLDIPGNVSSQYISALLMIGPMMRRGLTLRLTGGIASRPYIDLTLCTMQDFGADAEWIASDTIEVAPKPYAVRDYFAENDWSGASYWYQIMALSADRENSVKLLKLTDGSRQGDSVVRYLFSMLGVKTLFATRETGTPTTVTLESHGTGVPHMDYDFVSQPDLAQTVVVTCCALGIPFHFTGLASLRIKETDRIAALETELRKLGYVLEDRNDCELIWDGTRCEPEADPAIDTYEDHRMAMAFAPLALVMPSITINDPHVVSKSYPGYWDDLRSAGFTIEELP